MPPQLARVEGLVRAALDAAVQQLTAGVVAALVLAQAALEGRGVVAPLATEPLGGVQGDVLRQAGLQASLGCTTRLTLLLLKIKKYNSKIIYINIFVDNQLSSYYSDGFKMCTSRYSISRHNLHKLVAM